MGVVGGVVGVLLGNLFALASTLLSYGPRLVGQALAEQYSVVAGGALSALVAGAVLSVVAALYPAQFAARMLPAAALRSNV
jgi:ABC-type lipoprotein release transport system permease subunit